ncbi:hypothetical protein PE067_15880 [Paracoccus sp. DMF-8]|uniref:hypothetical protein n=1 Tax=Paracoccus sp. DMF-8 TaxID=3019445 RepID=UPI0023E39358|nr:hypothetical protein [Paracoccus sp. DMF-8]MDF3607487.1 hypothetical protein [Paracoccus sp. DMF-8]
MRQLIDLPEDGDGAKAEAGLEMMRRRAQRGDPEAALHIMNHVALPLRPADPSQGVAGQGGGGDPLEVLNATVDFEIFRPILDQAAGAGLQDIVEEGFEALVKEKSQIKIFVCPAD